jgi:hypothetical protein
VLETEFEKMFLTMEKSSHKYHPKPCGPNSFTGTLGLLFD